MRGSIRHWSSLVAAGAIAAVVLAIVPAAVSSAGPRVCSGTFSSPGVLAGTYWTNVVVRGVCAVNGGPAVVHGDVTVTGGSALVAAFGANDVAGSGTSSLSVTGDVYLSRNAAAVLGCEPEAFPCLDDPTLTSSDTIGNNLIVTNALGVIVHASTIKGWVNETGGGGGVTCTPTPGSAFAAFQSPDYSDYEDNTVGHGIEVSHVRSCWFGALRNTVGQAATFSRNAMADPDAMEIATNTFHGNLACSQNSPNVQFGDSDGSPNVVYKHATGQCGFKVLQPDPAPNGPMRHISVHPKA